MTTKAVSALPSVADLERNLKDKTKAFDAAAAAAREAVDALRLRKDELGEAQRAFDLRVSELRRGAPADSHWGDETPRGQAASAIARTLRIAAE